MLKMSIAVGVLIVAGFIPALASDADLVGTWQDKGNANNKMTVSKQNGLLRLKGGEDFGNGQVFQYQAACAPEMEGKPYLNCVGWGGQLNGMDFIYSSRLRQNGDGTLLEEWFAENGDRVSGKTTWIRKK